MGTRVRSREASFLVWGILIGSLFFMHMPASGEASACDDLSKVASEFMDLELAGARWQGGGSPCLPKLKLKLIRPIQATGSADPALLDPDYLLPKTRKLEIKTRRLPQDLLELRISYLGRKFSTAQQGASDLARRADVPVQDALILKLHFGRAREEKGCATLHKAPAHLVMREGCAEE
jgi:hypothetical protein